MKNLKNQGEVNAGSMADIAFLLLIFFLVTTTIPNDEGIPQKLPRACENPPCEVDFHERNIFRVTINKNNAILVENNPMSVKELRDAVKAFVDNNGDGSCEYCTGFQLKNASDNPAKALTSIQSDRETEYSYFITVQNELIGAYHELREAYAVKKFKSTLENLSVAQLDEVKKAYPQVISEAETY